MGSSPSWITREVISSKSLTLVPNSSFLIGKLVPTVEVCHEDEMRWSFSDGATEPLWSYDPWASGKKTRLERTFKYDRGP